MSDVDTQKKRKKSKKDKKSKKSKKDTEEEPVVTQVVVTEEPAKQTKKKSKKSKKETPPSSPAPVHVAVAEEESPQKKKKKKKKKSKKQDVEAPAPSTDMKADVMDDESASPAKKKKKKKRKEVDISSPEPTDTLASLKKHKISEKEADQEVDSSSLPQYGITLAYNAENARHVQIAREKRQREANEAKLRESGDKIITRRFQRVKEDAIMTLPAAMRDAAFNPNKLGGGSQWGAKASADLVVVRGKGFRHEKTKKKRGNYRGGKMDLTVRSVKF